MAFSGALTLTDLNDFITPSQACIKPVEQTNAQEVTLTPGQASTEIQIDTSGAYFEISNNSSQTLPSSNGTSRKLEQAQINLNDCLACSGCITSAESVLITLQSHTEVLTFLDNNHDPSSYKTPVISVAPQSLASLAASLSSSSSQDAPTPRQVLRRIQAFCKDVLGFAHVFDTTFARHMALREHLVEFDERSRREKAGEQGQLPMLASACPGWICYAEKAHAEMLPFISTTKSPQQVMGTLVKRWMGQRWGKLPHQVYHVTVMPCYDKKLEASRKDFYDELYSTRDVDCVITTGELELMMREKGWDLSIPVANEHEKPSTPSLDDGLPELLTPHGSSSGSWLQSIITHVETISPVPLKLSVNMLRNADFEEYTLRKDDGSEAGGEVVFKGAKCYGFRNLQNVVRKVGREKGVRTGTGAAGRLGTRAVALRSKNAEGKQRAYDYVEVMACPGGCVNGGGQLKPPAVMDRSSRDEEGYLRKWEDEGVSQGIESKVMDNARWGDKEWVKRVEEVYWKGEAVSTWEAADRIAEEIIKELSLPQKVRTPIEGPVANVRHELFRTGYRAVESDVIGLAVKW